MCDTNTDTLNRQICLAESEVTGQIPSIPAARHSSQRYFYINDQTVSSLKVDAVKLAYEKRKNKLKMYLNY